MPGDGGYKIIRHRQGSSLINSTSCLGLLTVPRSGSERFNYLDASASRPVTVLGLDGRSEKDPQKPNTGRAVMNERRLN